MPPQTASGTSFLHTRPSLTQYNTALPLRLDEKPHARVLQTHSQAIACRQGSSLPGEHTTPSIA